MARKNRREIVGVIGVGEMGFPIAVNLLKARFPVIVYDTIREKIEKITKLGASEALSPVDLMKQASAVITMLPDSKAVKLAAFGRRSDGFLNSAENRHTIIEMSTIDVETTLQISREVRAKGGSFLDAPVGGTPDMVVERKAEILASGDKQVVRKCKKILDAISSNVVFVGPVGAGKTLKLATNLLIGMNKLALAEALSFAIANNIDPETVLQVIGNSNANSTVFQRYGRAVVDRGRKEERIKKKHSWQLKDLGLALNEARLNSIPLPLGRLSEHITREASKNSGGAENFESIVKYYGKIMKLGR